MRTGPTDYLEHSEDSRAFLQARVGLFLGANGLLGFGFLLYRWTMLAFFVEDGHAHGFRDGSMTCSARLPVYTLVIATLFPVGHVAGFLPVQGLLMVAMYLFSTVTALVAAWVLSRSVKPLRAKRLPFVLELPPYRLPRLRDVGRMSYAIRRCLRARARWPARR